MGAVAGALRHPQRPGGSNNDADPWFGDSPPAETAAQTAARTAENARRTAADLRWLDAAFAQAQQDDAEGRDHDRRPTCGIAKRTAHVANYDRSSRASRRTRRVRQAGAAIQRRLAHLPLGQPAEAGAPCPIESGSSTVACSNDAAATQIAELRIARQLSERLELPPRRRAWQHAADGVAAADDHTGQMLRRNPLRSARSPGSAFSPAFHNYPGFRSCLRRVGNNPSGQGYGAERRSEGTKGGRKGSEGQLKNLPPAVRATVEAETKNATIKGPARC